MQTVQHHELPFQLFIKLLNIISFPDDLIWKWRLFQILSPFTFKRFAPKVIWFHSGVSRFNLYCYLTNLLFSLILQIIFLNSRFNLLFYIYQRTKFPTHIHSLSPSLPFLINHHNILSNYCIKVEAFFPENFQGF